MLLPLVCAELIHRAVRILDPAARGFSAQTGPPLDDRLESVNGAYLAVALRQGLDEARAIRGLTPVAWKAPQLLWSRIEQRVEAERDKGARPAWIWR